MLPLHLPPPELTRDAFGVAIIVAKTRADAWRAAGYAAAEDRLWQMEMSRRSAHGTLAEVLGPSALAGDLEVRKTSYTAAELQAQIDNLPAPVREQMDAYSAGVNQFIAQGPLPQEFATNGFAPQPWTPLDSAAIAVRFLQFFGRGGAGAVRNLAALLYLQGQKPLGGRVLDVLDDFLWQNDPASPTTLARKDEKPNHPIFFAPTRQITETHLALLPKLSLLELLPGLSVASRESSTRVAQRVGAPFKNGSYCMVVDGNHSATGFASLLSGPQMGFTTPSIVHEMSVEAPDLHVVGMDLPGVPGVLIGHTRSLAWGVTSGVADTDDIVFAQKTSDRSYKWGSATLPIDEIPSTIHVKGAADVPAVQQRTKTGPVLFETRAHGDQPSYLFSRHSSYAGAELRSLAVIEGLADAPTVQDADKLAQNGSMSFNAFFADTRGNIAFRYCGMVPIRTQQLDPRFPVPADPRYDWKGIIPPSQMPAVINPENGLLTNWNNKPASWWANGDTPVWGRIFRVDAIRRALGAAPLAAQDLELAAWQIARTDETWPFFQPWFDASAKRLGLAHDAGGFRGRLLQSSRQALLYRNFLVQLRHGLFNGTVGNFMRESLAEQIAQPSVMLAALQHRTKFDYLSHRSPDSVVDAALRAADEQTRQMPDGYQTGQIRVPDEAPIPYSNRGTYIQVIELLSNGPYGRTVAPPGESASGPHSRDQVPLSRAWTFKPMHPLSH